MADVLTDLAGLPAPGPATGTVATEAEAQANQYLSKGSNSMISARMPELVKGAGFAGPGGNKPLDNFTVINTKAAQATLDIRSETWRGYNNKSAVVGSLNQGWLNDFGALKAAMTQMSPLDLIKGAMSYLPGGSEALAEFMGKSFTAGNLGISSVSGLTPFNLLAPSRLIYPVYTVYRRLAAALRGDAQVGTALPGERLQFSRGIPVCGMPAAA